MHFSVQSEDIWQKAIKVGVFNQNSVSDTAGTEIIAITILQSLKSFMNYELIVDLIIDSINISKKWNKKNCFIRDHFKNHAGKYHSLIFKN